MPLQKYIERIRYMDSLIKTKATGSAKQLAKKLVLSERTTLHHIKIMKELGCPIKYCRKRNSYYYESDGKMVISFLDNSTSNTKNFGGGGNFIIFFVKKPNCNNTAVMVYNLVLSFKNVNTLTLNYGTKFSYKFKQCSKALCAAA
jgi:biotin operon repressor